METDEGTLLALRMYLARHRPHSVHVEGYRRAAVLVPCLYGGNEPELLLTERTHTVETHKGQVSFPGGVVDDRDAGPAETALRETAEEIGVPASSVEILGTLDDHATPTGFVITPVVGVLRRLPVLTPNVDEVAEVLFVPIRFFADPTNALQGYRMVEGKRLEVWTYRWGRHTIWGATAWIIRSLLRTTEKALHGP
jgi:8-oxo-dGTP pyrophosphatase MutT (NUDIX family)